MSLRAAMQTFIKHRCDRAEMLIPCWALTYNVSEEAVREEWDRQMSEASQHPANKYGEGEE